MIKQLKIMPLFRIELTLSFLLFLTSLSSLAQSGLQSGTPNWLPYSIAQAKYSQNYGVTTNTDTDGDGVTDDIDLDDDNDGILDTNECPLIDISSNLVELNPTETERKSYEIANGFAAGQRTVFNGTFLQEVADQLRSTSALRGLLYIGIPKDPIHTTEVMVLVMLAEILRVHFFV